MNGMLVKNKDSLELSPNLANKCRNQIVHSEQKWLLRPEVDSEDDPASKLTAFRWTGLASQPQEEVAEVESGCPVLGITLRPTDITLFSGQKLIHQGRMQPDTVRINEPGQPLRGIYRGRYDTLHLYIPEAVVADCVESGFSRSKGQAVLLGPSHPTLDPAIGRLARALVCADDFGSPFGRCYAESIGIAIVARLLGRNAEGDATTVGLRVSALPKWRLKRARDFIEAHLSESIGLAEIAASAGLTRMHFAAQFRVTTGLPPHEYLIRRRIERAQELLTSSSLPLIEIALDVGFKSQSHFTTVFRRIVGQTPRIWRTENFDGNLWSKKSVRRSPGG
jgi:AraC family transcriptional regulator